MVQKITHLGELGTPGELVRPLIWPLNRDDGTAWDLTGYTAPELRAWDILTRTAVAITGTVAIAQDDPTGTTTGEPDRWYVSYAPAAGDFPQSGQYEARIYVRPADLGAKEPSGMFRFTIAAGANP